MERVTGAVLYDLVDKALNDVEGDPTGDNNGQVDQILGEISGTKLILI